MPIVFEEPPRMEGPGGRFKERSPERKEMDELLSTLTNYPDQWARLYDFPEEDKEGADKHAGKIRSAAGYLNTGNAWSVAVRRTGQGWSIFAKMSNEPARKRAPKKDKSAETQEQGAPDAHANGEAPVAEQAREATFQ